MLVAHPAEDLRPLYSPDGANLAFQSSRTGGGDIYILTIATGELKRLTFDDGAEFLDGWSRDGKWIYFSSGSQDVNRKNDLFRVKAEGGTPMAFSADRFTNEFQAAPSPDGTAVAFAARGNGDQQWWRNGHSHLDESEIWLWKTGGAYTQLANRKGRNMWPMWNPDGKTLYFMSDRGGAQNLWSMTVPAGVPTMKQLTKFSKGRVLFPTIAYDGKTIVFEHEFRIWKYDVKSGEAAAVPLTLAGSGAGPAMTRMPVAQFGDLTLSPDGRKITVTGRGEVFAASARDGGDGFRVTRTAGAEQQVAWAPDSSKIAYVAQRDDAVAHVFLYDFGSRKETQLTAGQQPDAAPRFSPDGKTLSYVRDRAELHLLELESKQDRVLVKGSLSGGAVWSHDGKWIAYVAAGSQGLRNVHVIPVAAKDASEAKQISFLPNTNSNSIVWHPDGKALYFVTGQRTESPQIAKIDLVPVPPTFAETRFEELFKAAPEAPAARGNAAKPAPKPVEIVFEGIRERLTFLPVGLDVFAPQISPDGRTLLFTTQVAGQANLYTYPLETGAAARGPRTARQLTSTPGNKSGATFTPDGREVMYLEGGRVQIIPLDTRVARAVNVNAETDVDFQKEKIAVFEQAWAGQRDGFYDPKMHGVDWKAVHATYKPLVEAATSRDELYRLLRLMVGELNASHSGITAPPAAGAGGPGGPRGTVGQLGVRFDREAAESAGKLKISEVLPQSPAALAKLQVGDEITAVDGEPVSAAVNFDEQMLYKIGRRVSLTVNGSREVTVQPVGSVADLMYRKWVEENRAYVHKVSGGKLGYVHIRDMSDTALKQLYFDLDAENRAKSGVVIDIRNNNGGFVNAYALDVFTRRGYMTMTSRGAPPSPARTSLGQRSLELPTILVVNQHSLSDAEDFTEGYRTLKLGKVVGEPTSGWIIYTGAMELVDGSSMRMPGTLITGADGKNMELNPRPVDVPVTRPIGETYTGKDSQLDVAVKELLAGVK
ncbi:peptidase S41 [Bryobacterales bacterium F-183]|nr:peptidase S41 [Bryobacterales bacterium F-183]